MNDKTGYDTSIVKGKWRDGVNFTRCEWIQQRRPQWQMEEIPIVCPTSNSKINNTVYLQGKLTLIVQFVYMYQKNLSELRIQRNSYIYEIEHFTNT
jgi:hypothetical protein